jgi:hypothetical protein
VQVLDLRTGIDFGSRGNLKEYSPVGFSAVPDDVSTWSEASLAEVMFQLPMPRQDIRFTVETFPFLAGGRVPRQDCWVFFNGLFVHFQAIKTPVELVFTVTRDQMSTRANRLSFALPNATSPNELRQGGDMRLLGLAFVKLSAADASAAAASPAVPRATPAGPRTRIG